MRKSTLLWLALAALCGTSLFYTSAEVHAGRERIDAMSQNIQREMRTLHTLRAEWDYLNQPQRLEALAKKHLTLAPLKGAQLIVLDNLPLRAPEEEAAGAVHPALNAADLLKTGSR